MRRLLLFLALLHVSTASAFANGYLVKDLNTTFSPIDSDPSFLGNLGSRSYFSAYSPESGVELWVTDGSAEGSRIVVDLAPGSASGVIHRSPGSVGDSFLFSAAPGGAFGVWATDGTAAGTRKLLSTTAESTRAVDFHARSYFVATTPETGRELFRTDGTAEGTVPIDLMPGTASSSPTSFRVLDDAILFFGTTPSGTGLHRSDGTVAGTILITPGAAPSSVAQLDPRIVFLRRAGGASASELWASDGTTAGTSQLASIPDTSSNPSRFVGVVAGNALLASPTDLWRTDGTVSGTHVVMPVDGPPGSGVVTSTAAFFFTRGPTGRSLWTSDGTLAGTKLLKKVDGANSLQLAAAEELVYFAAHESATGSEIWCSDGTESGTRMVIDLAEGTASSMSTWAALPRADGLLIRANDHRSGRELWFTRGTAAETRMVKNIASDLNASSNPEHLASVGSTLFFIASDGEGSALWRLPEGGNVERVAGVARKPGYHVGVASGALYYFTQGDVPSVELWRSDGTAAGTFKLHTYRSSRYYGTLVPFAGGLIFGGEDAEHGLEPWFTDGTVGGTRIISDLRPGIGNWGYGIAFGGSDGHAYLFGNSAVWRSDLTSAGTVKLSGGEVEGERFDHIEVFAELNGAVYFINRVHDAATSLWVTDGTQTGTRRVIRFDVSGPPVTLVRSGDRLFLQSSGTAVWSSDGTSAGTHLLTAFADPTCTTIAPRSLATLKGVSYWLTSFGPGTRSGLWRSDGTATGTYRVSVSGFGSLLSCYDSPRPTIVVVGDRLYFAEWDDTHGYELWTSDGTEEGTRPVADIVPGKSSSMPGELTPIGSAIYFRASTLETGTELFVVRSSSGRRRGVRR